MCKGCVYKDCAPVHTWRERNSPPCLCTEERVDSFVTNYLTEFLVTKQLPNWYWFSPCAGLPAVPSGARASPGSPCRAETSGEVLCVN